MISRLLRTQVLFVASLLIPATLATAQGRARGARYSPFVAIEDTGRRGVATLACDLEHDSPSYLRLAGLHASGQPCELDMPMPGGRTATLELRPVSCMAPGARAVIVEEDGREVGVEPRVKCFSGSLQGGGQVFIGFAPEQVHGYVAEGGELYFLSSSGSPLGLATLAHASQTGTSAEDFAEFCRVDDPGEPDRLEALGTPGPILRVADVAIEADDSMSRRLGSGDRALDYVTLLITASGEIMRRDLGLLLRVPDGYLRVWKAAPPWGNTTIDAVRHWYKNRAHPENARQVAMVQSLAGGFIMKGYAAGVGGVCDKAYGGYAHSTCLGGFPYPTRHTDPGNSDLFTVTHEFGHVLGSPHSFNFEPPVLCDDGSGPDRGTLMTWCHFVTGSIANVGMRFHLREQLRIRNVLRQRPCIKTVPLLPGDYDGDGVRSRGDLVAALGVHRQGFRSLGAQETFDLDRDGDFDSLDLEILTQIVSGAAPASATVRNGTDKNPRCLESLTNPVLGSTWLARVTAKPDGRSSLLLVSEQATRGLSTPFGELFLRANPLDGRLRSTALVPFEHGEALHAISLPLDLSLSQRSFSVQAAVLGGSSGPVLCNALDLFLSPF